MKFTSSEFKLFREDFNKTVKPLEDKYGLTIDLGNISYSSTEFNTKMTCKKTEFIRSEEEDFAFYCERYGFKPEHFKALFTIQGTQYELIGFNPNARVNNCIIRRYKDGKDFIANNFDIRRAMNIA